MGVDLSVPVSIVLLVAAGTTLLAVGLPFARTVDALADRTGIGEAMAGALLVGATTSLPGIITTGYAAASGEPSLAVANAVGGIAVQTTFLAVADLTYRRANLEHAAASLPNILQTTVLIALVGLVMAASWSPDETLGGIHPATFLLVAGYGYGLVLVRRARDVPMWRPRNTGDTVEDDPDEADDDGSVSTRALWLRFAGMGVLIALSGFAVASGGISLVRETSLSGSLVGGLFTSVITSLPELVTAVAAVRIGALTLAVGDIVGGNTFDVLFVAVADVLYRPGSVYHAIEQRTSFLLALTVVLTAVLAAGLVHRSRKGIGFEGVGILVIYALGIVSLVLT
jgi:cation:H+ antiporter